MQCTGALQQIFSCKAIFHHKTATRMLDDGPVVQSDAFNNDLPAASDERILLLVSATWCMYSDTGTELEESITVKKHNPGSCSILPI
jgi:hypothetical protein